jgi:hypothetical protein
MRWCLAAVALCACNQVLGIRETKERDASISFFDAPLDAPFACPPIGTAPEFSRLFHQQVLQDCNNYNISAGTGRAVADCQEPAAQVSQGGVGDTTLTPIPGLGTQGTVRTYEPRISPEGDELLVHHYNGFALPHDSYELLRRDGEMWLPASGFSSGSGVEGRVFGAMTLGPVRRIMMYDLNDATVHELSFDATGVTTEIHVYTASELGVTFLFVVPNLTEDGLRMVFVSAPAGQSTSKAMYSDRQSTSDVFRPAVPLPGAPSALDIFLTRDCAKLYFSAAGSVFYAQQR